MATQDKQGNFIGSVNVDFKVLDLSEYGVTCEVSKAETTESVYVYYKYEDKIAIVRFSNHTCNGVKFGDYLNGHFAGKEEILHKLGLMTRTFVPATQLFIGMRQVKKSEQEQYEEAELTIKEMYALGANADLSAYVGKRARGSRWLIIADRVKVIEITRRDEFGQLVRMGDWKYEMK